MATPVVFTYEIQLLIGRRLYISG